MNNRGKRTTVLFAAALRREREQWERLAAGWPCPLRGCGKPGTALIYDWSGRARPVCTDHAEEARREGLHVVTPEEAAEAEEEYAA